MSTTDSDRKSVMIDDQELFYKRLRWDALTLLTPLIILLDIEVMGVESEKKLALTSAAFFTLLVGMRLALGVRGKRKSNHTLKNYRLSMLVLGLQNAMVSSAFVYMFTLHGLGNSNTAILLAVLIGLLAYVLFSFQLNRPYFIFHLSAFCLPLLTLPYYSPGTQSWAFLGAALVVSLYFLKTIKLNSHILMSLEDKGRVLEELNQLNSRGEGVHSDRLVFLGEMASGVAHEINNPLTVIQGKSEISLKKLEQGEFNSDDVRPLLESVLTQTKRAAKIVSSLKKFASVSSEEPLKNESLNMVVAESLDLCFEKFKKVGIEIQLDLSYQGPLECRANELSQVILSLMSNAYDELISQKSGYIKISSEKVGNWLELSVCDNGQGIPADQMQRVFMPFFSTKPENKGVGLGLAVSRGVIESHGGQLLYERIDGRSCFIVILPLTSKLRETQIPEPFQFKIQKFEKLLKQYEWQLPAVRGARES